MANPSDKGAPEPRRSNRRAHDCASYLRSVRRHIVGYDSGHVRRPGWRSAGQRGAGQSSTGFGSGQPTFATPSGQPSRAADSDASVGDGLRDAAQSAADAVRRQAAQFAGDVGHELSRTGEAAEGARRRGDPQFRPRNRQRRGRAQAAVPDSRAHGPRSSTASRRSVRQSVQSERQRAHRVPPLSSPALSRLSSSADRSPQASRSLASSRAARVSAQSPATTLLSARDETP